MKNGCLPADKLYIRTLWRRVKINDSTRIMSRSQKFQRALQKYKGLIIIYRHRPCVYVNALYARVFGYRLQYGSGGFNVSRKSFRRANEIISFAVLRTRWKIVVHYIVMITYECRDRVFRSSARKWAARDETRV